MKHIRILLLSLLMLCWFSACRESALSDDPTLRLSFSVDTVCFDTVFTTFGSSTKRVMIYNKIAMLSIYHLFIITMTDLPSIWMERMISNNCMIYKSTEVIVYISLCVSQLIRKMQTLPFGLPIPFGLRSMDVAKLYLWRHMDKMFG